jgi:recombinational DNA repair protein RecR
VEEVIDELDELPAAGGKSAVIRHAIVVGEDQRMQLELQSLPATLAYVNGKPFFRG